MDSGQPSPAAKLRRPERRCVLGTRTQGSICHGSLEPSRILVTVFVISFFQLVNLTRCLSGSYIVVILKVGEVGLLARIGFGRGRWAAAVRGFIEF